MARSSLVHYIAPSAFGITPNCNGSENDLDVYLARGAKIKVYSPSVGIGTEDSSYREWSIRGRNRRLGDSARPYTIYARLSRSDGTDGYLVFAPKVQSGAGWIDKYPYPTSVGMSPGTAGTATGAYWYVRLGDVSLPEGGRREVTFDTGVLGTDQYNSECWLNPDRTPLHVEIACSVDGEASGPVPYVPWGKAMRLTATLAGAADGDRADSWTIVRSSGDPAADAAWPGRDRAAAFASSGTMLMNHLRDDDDFRGTVSSVFTVTAWGVDGSGAVFAIASASVTVFAETNEKYELVLSTSVMRYTPPTDTYTPAEGVMVRVRAIDQAGSVEMLTLSRVSGLRLSAGYAEGGVAPWTALVFSQDADGLARATLPVSAFASQQNVVVRLLNVAGAELTTSTVAYVRDGADSREREWIYLRSETEIDFGPAGSEHPLPALIPGGEVEPEGAAGGDDTDKDQDGWVPEGWWDEMQGTDDTYRYEYTSYRNFIYDDREQQEGEGPGHWGEFSDPVIWSSRGEDGVTYRCRWTLYGREVFQLVASVNGALHGRLPLVATLMKRKGVGVEEPVIAESSEVTVTFEGLSYSVTVQAQSPRFAIREQDTYMVQCLNDPALTALSIQFAVGGETFSYAIPVMHEADQDAMRDAVERYGSQMFLSKLFDDVAQGVIGFAKGAWFGVRDWFIDAEGNGVLQSLVSDRLQSTKYTGDGMFDSGFLLQYLRGKAKLVVDQIVCRGKFVVHEIESRVWTYAGGNLVFSSAGSTIFYVEYLDADGTALGYTYFNSPWLLGRVPLLARVIAWSKRRQIQRTLTPEEKARVAAFRCYEVSDDGTMQTRNWWRAGDIALCNTLNRVRDKGITRGSYSGELSNTVYARRVLAVGSKRIENGEDLRIYDYVDLSLADCDPDYDDWPAAGDVLVQRGSFTDPDRQGISTIEVTGDERGYKVYDGLDGWDMGGRKKAFIGYDARNRRALLEVFGDCYIGAMGDADVHDGETYIRFDSVRRLLSIKARIEASSTVGDEDVDLGDYINMTVAPAIERTQEEQDEINERVESTAVTLQLLGGDAMRTVASLDRIKQDGKVDKAEKVSIRCDLDFMGHYYERAIRDAEYYGIETGMFEQAWQAGRAAMLKYSAAAPEEIAVEEDFDDIAAFMNAYADMLQAIADAANEKVDNITDDGVITGGAEKSSLTIDYLRSVSEYRKYMEQAEDYFGDQAAARTAAFTAAFVNMVRMLNNGDEPTQEMLDGTWYPAWINSYTGFDSDTVLADTPTRNSTNYRAVWSAYYTQLSALLEAIAEEGKRLSGAAQASADSALSKLGDMASDSKLDPSEKRDVRKEFESYYHEMMDPSGILDKAKNSGGNWIIDYNTWIKPYQDAFAAIGTYLNGGATWTIPPLSGFSDGSLPSWISSSGMQATNDVSGQAWRSLWSAFYTRRASILTTLTEHAQATADAAASAASTAQGDVNAMKYLKDAMAQKTDVVGGLILSSMLVLRDRNGGVKAGMNGIYTDGGTIAFWCGGPNVDHERSQSSPYASILFRMDGSGYVAGGNISWNSGGTVTLSGNSVSASTFILSGQDVTSALKSLLGMFTMDGSSIKANYSFYSVGEISMYSDIRLKDVKEEVELDIRDIAGASVIRFSWKGSRDGKQLVGGVAQEWQRILPEAVSETEDGMLAMNYDAIDYASVVSLARKAVDQQRKIEELERRLERMEAMLGLNR